MQFSAIMNDGLRWVGNNTLYWRNDLIRQNTETKLFIVNPQSDFCKALANETSIQIDKLTNKINQTINLIESTYNRSQKKGSLKIYYLKNYPAQTLFYSEDRVIITPYQTSSGRSIRPFPYMNMIKVMLQLPHTFLIISAELDRRIH